jgi:ABC-type cobalamin/Fe3+-siderophores transport system ATPase subunit
MIPYQGLGMIRKVVLRRFKRFQEEAFEMPGHIVLAGPNNTGKTTVLQALAAWGLAISRWKELNDFRTHNSAYSKAPISRQAFSAVPLRVFDLLWNQRAYTRNTHPIEIEVHTALGKKVAVELVPDSTEQIYVRPKPDADIELIKSLPEMSGMVYVPPMTGLSTQEPVYTRPKLNQLLGQGKPGDVIRNLLVEAHQSEEAWPKLTESIRRIFGYELLSPDAAGADILVEYQVASGAKYDIASAGSGFQQVLMLLSFLHTRPGSVLLLDEPDAHLHVILQDSIYSELRSVAATTNSQLIVATHSEVIINSVDPLELCMLLHRPTLLATTAERTQLIKALKILSNVDIMLALQAPGVFYTEDYTDLDILREWARILRHPVTQLLQGKLFWQKTLVEPRPGAKGIPAKDHYEALRLVREDLPGLELLDGDAHPDIPPTAITGSGLQRERWRRYEIESYLFVPSVLARYVEHLVGDVQTARPHLEDLQKYLTDNLPPAVLRDPLGEHPFLNATKARTNLIPPVLAAAGLPGVPYTRYHEIAAVMQLDEIHPEVREKLDAIQKAFRL